MGHPGGSFEVWSGGRQLASLTLEVPGRHNVLNALACFATLTELGVPAETTARSLRLFRRGGASFPT